MRGLVAPAIACGLALNGFAPTWAQPAADTGIDCVYNDLTPNARMVAEVFLDEEQNEKAIEEAGRLVDVAVQRCAIRNAYKPGQPEAVGEIGVYASVIDFLGERLVVAGASDDAVRSMISLYDALSDEEVDKLFALDWRSDAAFYGKLEKAALDAGIPDIGIAVDSAMAIFELRAKVEQSSYLFMMAERESAPSQAQ